MSRIVVVSLLITALAGPYNPVTVTEIDESPAITVLSDDTASMDIFEAGSAQEIFDYLQGQAPARMEIMRGLRSDIGDEILSVSAGGDHVVVVSDGNNNFGRDLGETIDFVSNTGTKLYAVTQTSKQNDLSVRITGARTAVVGNENLVGVVVSQAQNDAKYSLTIKVDGEVTYSEPHSQTSAVKTISFANTFNNLGPHVITAVITSNNDTRPDNNVYNKTIYVVPKPKLLFVSSDKDSPVHTIVGSLYQTDTSSGLGNVSLSDYKAVVLDNLNKGQVDRVNDIREYVAGGGGLVAIGGDNSYDFGDYLNSSLETMLPVESYSSTYAGSVNVVIVLDISGSISAHNALDDVKAMAINLLMGMGRDTNVGVVAFGGDAVQVSDGLLPMSGHANRDSLVDRVTKLKTGFDGTSIDEGIKTAREMLDNDKISGQKYMLIFSDGAIKNRFEDSKTEIASIDTTETKMIFVMIKTNVVKEQDVRTNMNRGDYFLKVLADQAGGEFYLLELNQRLDLKFGQESADIPADGAENFAVVRLDDDHFITRYLNISGSVSGFNDVTQKVGARRLVTTSMGKPIVTSWQFGLGRVVSMSTDNGNFWAGALYSGENARLLPSIINWVVGDPQPDDGVVVYSSDLDLGSAGTITILSDNVPTVTYDAKDVALIQTGDRTYEGVLDPTAVGVFRLDVSAGGTTREDTVAVNYPLEYRDIGNNPEFLEAVKRNSGKVYTIEQAKSMLFNDIRENSVITTVEHVSMSWLFLLAALLVFLAEVIIRRAKGIIDIKMRRKGDQE